MTDETANQDTEPAQPQVPVHTLVARMATGGGPLPRLDSLNTFIRMMFKGSPKLEAKSEGPAGMVLVFGDVEVALSAVPVAIPFDEIAGACARSWMWPEATTAMEAATHHVVATCRCADRVSGAMALTKVVAAVLDDIDGVGVHFCEAGTVASADQFFQFARDMKPDVLPLYLWLGFHAFEEEGGATTVYTTGMPAFGLAEVEAARVEQPLQVVSDVVYSVVHHRLLGATFADGDELDLGDGLVLSVGQGPGRFRPEQTVLQLSFG